MSYTATPDHAEPVPFEFIRVARERDVVRDARGRDALLRDPGSHVP
jgi:hypothetical protein